MAEMTIQLRRNPVTGKQDILIDMKADEDALPHEHEQQHKAMVDKLLEKGLLKEGDIGDIIIEREEEHGIPEVGPSSQQKEREAMGQGGR